jgi:ectoine hydroxylase-related dioxygenase (phytanoyl-CoA dioxygenase family)
MDLINDNGYAMVYYCHDADGETVLFDKRYNQAMSHDPRFMNYGAYTLKEIARITPKKGRAVLFHSNRFHASSNPVVAQRRVIINHVFTTDDNFLTKID